MKTSNNKICRIAFSLCALFLALAACNKEKDYSFIPSRMFTPMNVRVTTAPTNVTLMWNRSMFSETRDVEYTVEVAEDSSFQQPLVYSVTTDTNMVVLTENNLDVRRQYIARIKANATGTSTESNWMISAPFTIPGEQIFLPINPAELRDRSVRLRWQESEGITNIVITPSTGDPIDVVLEADDISARETLVTGLTASTSYTAEIFAGTRSKGTVNFETREPSIFTEVVAPGDDLLAIIANASNGDVIGLEPGTHDYSATTFVISGKHITLQSTSGNPLNTLVHFREVTLRGDGAGVRISGIEFDGTTANAGYFINLAGLNSDSEPATFSSILVENCIIHGTANSLLRGNRGGNNAHKIDFIRFDNNIIFNNGSGGFDYILLDKMEFNRLELTRSTFYNSGRRLISWATNITTPQRPVILIDQVTINSIGYSGRDNVLFDANANDVDFTLRNSIIANTPKAGQTVGNNAMRVNNASASVVITNNNFFKLSNGASPAADLVFAITPQNHRTIDLGWTSTTNEFTIPAGSELRSAGTTGGAIGDPRWIN